MRKKILHFSAAVFACSVLLVSCSKDTMVTPAKSTLNANGKISQPSSSPAAAPSNSNHSGGCNHSGGSYPQYTGS